MGEDESRARRQSTVIRDKRTSRHSQPAASQVPAVVSIMTQEKGADGLQWQTVDPQPELNVSSNKPKNVAIWVKPGYFIVKDVELTIGSTNLPSADDDDLLGTPRYARTDKKGGR